jgi:type VI protein secretion system component Hcp
MSTTKKSKKKLSAGKKAESVKPLTISKVVDASSPTLQNGCATGTHYSGFGKG